MTQPNGNNDKDKNKDKDKQDLKSQLEQLYGYKNDTKEPKQKSSNY